MSVSNFSTFLNLYLRKSYYKSVQWHFPKIFKDSFATLNFKLLQHSLKPYLYKSFIYLKEPSFRGKQFTNIIWMFWWQGYDQMPELVKKCILSFRNHAINYRVILITHNNINKYIQLPIYVYIRVLNKKRLAHFADIVRFNLLKKYGGLWCDADLFCTSTLMSNHKNYLYTVGGGIKHPYPPFTKGKWVIGLIGGYDHNALFTFMCKYLNLYWYNNIHQISYFISDFGLYFAYKNNIGGFKDYVDVKAKYNNPNFWKLMPELDKPFSVTKFVNLTHNTNIFRLTYKSQQVYSSNSFYNHLMRHIN